VRRLEELFHHLRRREDRAPLAPSFGGAASPPFSPPILFLLPRPVSFPPTSSPITTTPFTGFLYGCNRGRRREVGDMAEEAEINVEKHPGKMAAVTSTRQGASPWIRACGTRAAFSQHHRAVGRYLAYLAFPPPLNISS
jgi:hypothetical protein